MSNRPEFQDVDRIIEIEDPQHPGSAQELRGDYNQGNRDERSQHSAAEKFPEGQEGH